MVSVRPFVRTSTPKNPQEHLGSSENTTKTRDNATYVAWWITIIFTIIFILFILFIYFQFLLLFFTIIFAFYLFRSFTQQFCENKKQQIECGTSQEILEIYLCEGSRIL